ncbi:MAG: recombination regulator RecX [Candidatus Bipolaricaulota bacterium]|nr:recombination regulator RecX [Candidatus Bipolaricaulota bacterium]
MSEEERARAYLLRLLKHRPRSRYEALTRLQQRGFAQEIIESVLEQASRAGILDDAKFAQLWVEDRLSRRPRSRRALERELRAKGVAPELIGRALAHAELDEEALVKQLIAERLPRLRSLDAATRVRRLVGFLRRRGFSGHIIRRALRDAK